MPTMPTSTGQLSQVCTAALPVMSPTSRGSAISAPPPPLVSVTSEVAGKVCELLKLVMPQILKTTTTKHARLCVRGEGGGVSWLELARLQPKGILGCHPVLINHWKGS